MDNFLDQPLYFPIYQKFCERDADSIRDTLLGLLIIVIDKPYRQQVKVLIVVISEMCLTQVFSIFTMIWSEKDPTVPNMPAVLPRTK